MAYRLGDNLPRLIPLEAFKVKQNALELDNRKRWVRVVELNGHLLWELFPGALGFFEATHNVIE